MACKQSTKPVSAWQARAMLEGRRAHVMLRVVLELLRRDGRAWLGLGLGLGLGLRLRLGEGRTEEVLQILQHILLRRRERARLRHLLEGSHACEGAAKSGGLSFER